MKEDPTIRGCIALIVAFAVSMVLCLLVGLACSCKPQREVQLERVEVPVPIVQEHTIESVRVDHVRDTVVQRDSVFHYVKGDTVLIERWHYLQGSTNVVRVDTLIKVDSVQVPVEVVREKVVTKTEEVEKPLSWWQKTLMWMGFGLLIVIGWKIFKIHR